MKLTNKIKLLSKYKAKSKFPFWMNLESGHELLFELEIKNPGRSSNGLYTTDVKVTNLTSNNWFCSSITSMEKYLSHLEWEENV